jgi:hypothetical protein
MPLRKLEQQVFYVAGHVWTNLHGSRRAHQPEARTRCLVSGVFAADASQRLGGAPGQVAWGNVACVQRTLNSAGASHRLQHLQLQMLRFRRELRPLRGRWAWGCVNRRARRGVDPFGYHPGRIR